MSPTPRISKSPRLVLRARHSSSSVWGDGVDTSSTARSASPFRDGAQRSGLDGGLALAVLIITSWVMVVFGGHTTACSRTLETPARVVASHP